MKAVYALVDCNNFFVSCERIFQPQLYGKPVAVLSGNDGCVISRSQEAKKLGLAMGAPYFKNVDLIRHNNVAIFSSNFELYSDMSERVMSLLKRFSNEVDIYSVDEAFLRLDDVPDPEAYIRMIRKTIWQQTRIPVSIGLASSRTLAKAASHWAKDYPESKGVFNFLDKNLLEYLQQIPVEEVWGIGRNSAAFLQSKGIFTAQEFAVTDPAWIKKTMSIVGLRLAQELQGIPCDGHIVENPKRTIMCTRSFGRAVTDIAELRQAVAMHAAHAAEKLRIEGEIAGSIGLHIRTNRHNNDPKYSVTKYVEIETPTQFTPELSEQALRILDLIYKPGFKYWKVGVLCSNLYPESSCQQSMFEQRDATKEKNLMHVLDAVNDKFGTGTMRYAQTGIQRSWHAKREMLSKAFTTDINQLPMVYTR